MFKITYIIKKKKNNIMFSMVSCSVEIIYFVKYTKCCYLFVKKNNEISKREIILTQYT